MSLRLVAEGVPCPQIPSGVRKHHHEHQVEMIGRLNAEWQQAIMDGRPFRACFRLPTGGGKTRVATHWSIGLWSTQRATSILWLAHRKELLRQAANAFDEALRSREVGTFGAVRVSAVASPDSEPWFATNWPSGPSPAREIAICSQPAFAFSEPRRRLLAWADAQPELLVVVDEAHHAVASTYRSLLEALGVGPGTTTSMRPGRHLLGLSATPTRTDPNEQGPLRRLFGDRILSGASLAELVDRGFLAQPHVLPMEATVSLAQVVQGEAEQRYRVRWHDLHPESRRRLSGHLNDIAVERYGELVRNGHGGRRPPSKAIVFCVSTSHADELGRQFGMRGHFAASVHSKSADRDEVLRRFQLPPHDPRRLDVLTTVDLLTEGVDLPCTEIVIMLRPTMSHILFQQMVGRCLRGPKVLPGKTDAYILDLALNTDEFPHWMSAWELFDGDAPPVERRRFTAKQAAETAEPLEKDEFEADVASWLVEFSDVCVGRTLAGWYEIPDLEDEERHDLLPVFGDDQKRYREWAMALLQGPNAAPPDGLREAGRFLLAVISMGSEPPFHPVGESQFIDTRVAEMAANGITFGQAGLLRDRVREALLATRQRFGLTGDGGAPSWRAAMRTLDRRMTQDFLAALGT